MGEPIRYGIIGSGMMGIEHMRNLRLLDDAVLAAVADPHERSRGWAEDDGGPDLAIFEDAREMLDATSLDAVVIATPNHTHREVLENVLGRPLHVMVEKPLCTTLEDCRWVEQAAEQHPRIVWVGMQYRYMPPVAKLVARVREGAIGRLRMLAIREHRFPFLPKVGDWNRFARNTGGTLVEKCCHFFDLMRLIVDSPARRVYASGAMDVNHLDERYGGEAPDILDNAYVVVDFENDCRALLDLCMFAEGSRHQEEISATGDAGKLECFIPAATRRPPDLAIESTLVFGRRIPRAIEVENVPLDDRILEAGGHHGSTYFEHRAFIDAIRAGEPPEVGVRDGLLAVAMGIAAERSIATGCPVDLSELGL